MRALLITPLHESSEYLTMNLMVAFGHKGWDALSVPSYANYLHEVGLASSFEASILMALSSVQEFVADHADCVIIGNCDKSIEFDVIINVNIHHEEGVPIQDLQIEKMQEVYGADADIGPIINHLYITADGEYAAGGTVDQIVELVDNLCKAKRN